MSNNDRQRKIDGMRDRLVETPASVKLARLRWWMTHCWKCEAQVAFDAEACEACGEELMTNGKH